MGSDILGPNEDVRDFNGGNCDAPDSNKCVCICLVPHWVYIGLNYVSLTIAMNPNCNFTSPFGVQV